MKRHEFRWVQRGAKATSRHFIVYARPGPNGRGRLGLAVGRKVGRAVVRNAIKRRLREALRSKLPGVGLEMLVVAKGGSAALQDASPQTYWAELAPLLAQFQRRFA
ncbi:MAG: ribonuclease P protein component [Myxococcota bacterium]